MSYTEEEIVEIEEAKKFKDLPDIITNEERLEELSEVRIPASNKEFVDAIELEHRDFTAHEFWKVIPAFKNVTKAQFYSTKFQNRNTVRKIDQLVEFTKEIASEDFIAEVRRGMEQSPMSLSISPYILSLINWKSPENDPLRIQFIPMAGKFREDHPKLRLDSLAEQEDTPVDGLVHRYHDKVLFLPLDVCPVYCRFCTRSYAIGGDTTTVDKVKFKNAPEKWKQAFAYIASRPEIEDVVISGGDAYMLVPERLKFIGETLLNIPHVRRLRYATKGPAVMPMKILTDVAWTESLISVVNTGRQMGKEVVLHTHFNSAKEITEITREAMLHLFKNGVTVRNQSVLIRGVNDSPETMTELIKKLSFMNVQPYYVYQHDMVPGTEDMRTSVRQTIELEKAVRGVTAGFNTPLFVTDAPGGGGKRDVHSYDYYDPISGISIYRSPGIDQTKLYMYFDPIHLLPPEGQELWADDYWEGERRQRELIQNAIEQSGLTRLTPAQ